MQLAGRQISARLKYAFQNRPLDKVKDFNAKEVAHKLSYMLKVDLEKPEIEEGLRFRPFLFADSFIDDPSHYLYAKLSSEHRTNKVSHLETSSDFLKRAIGEDQLSAFKLGLKFNKNMGFNSVSECLSAHLSSKFESNWSDLKMVKTSAFLRYMKTINSFQVTASINSAHLNSWGSQPKINDKFYLKNFKGLSDIGVETTKNINMGLDKYIAAQLKISQVDCPLLSTFGIEPFIFGNAALVG